MPIQNTLRISARRANECVSLTPSIKALYTEKKKSFQRIERERERGIRYIVAAGQCFFGYSPAGR
jgi:hypothetical protein